VVTVAVSRFKLRPWMWPYEEQRRCNATCLASCLSVSAHRFKCAPQRKTKGCCNPLFMLYHPEFSQLGTLSDTWPIKVLGGHAATGTEHHRSTSSFPLKGSWLVLVNERGAHHLPSQCLRSPEVQSHAYTLARNPYAWYSSDRAGSLYVRSHLTLIRIREAPGGA
jgi:hypothetical protein